MALLEVRENPIRLTVRFPLHSLADAAARSRAGWCPLSRRTVLRHEHHLLTILNSDDSSNWLNSSKYSDKIPFLVYMVNKVAPVRPHSLSSMYSVGGPAMGQALSICERKQTGTCPPAAYKSLPPTHQLVTKLVVFG